MIILYMESGETKKHYYGMFILRVIYTYYMKYSWIWVALQYHDHAQLPSTNQNRSIEIFSNTRPL